jgi:polyisoprenyl-phosphate glycosyltransferase
VATEAVEVSVVVPVYQSRDTLEELASRLAAALRPRVCSYELLFVDDGSTDGSAEVLRRLGGLRPEVRVLALGRNRGQHKALLAGLAACRGLRAVTMDADLQDPPEAVPLLLAELDSGAGACFAGRRGAYESRSRLLTSALLKRLLHMASRGRIPVDAGLFLALDRATLDGVLGLAAPRTAYLPALVARTGVAAGSVPVARAPRLQGRSAYTALGRLRAACAACRSLVS